MVYPSRRFFLAFAILMAVATTANATDLHLSWNAVTVDVNGAALPAGSTVTYNVYGAIQGQPLKLIANVTTTTNVRPNVDAGTLCYAVSAVLVTPTTTTGVEGPQTALTCTTVLATPAAPTNLQIQQTPTPAS
jgi:hypothetical protein